MNRIVFTLPDVGLREIKGTAYVEEGFLVLHVKNALLGLVDEEKDVIKIEPQALDDLYIRRGLFRDRLVIRPKKATLLDVIPGEHASAVELRVRRKYRRELEGLIRDYEALT